MVPRNSISVNKWVSIVETKVELNILTGETPNLVKSP